ncbi:UbiE/COQ5 methyltransferase [Methanospirillum hungatei JF-1]|uniref:UbiE/COQ5 methyltransferase n=2 Tax=Methanospirillum hungatei TaxID=2203 RepID=Q2FNW3_METHJ|nr:UbiE/COQ5 methyltransferase [Methanospirillum hungatei JF-1]
MNESHICKGALHMTQPGPGHRRGKGPSSFWMQDPDIVFRELNLNEGDTFLDIGCGTGDYTIRAATEVGRNGTVFATDIQEGLVHELMKKAEDSGLENIQAFVNDIQNPLPFENNSIDICFISTVLHSLDLNQTGPLLLREIKRVLKKDGILVIIECNKENLTFGPPVHMRISADEIEKIVSPYGFVQISHADLGFNYLVTFIIQT